MKYVPKNMVQADDIIEFPGEPRGVFDIPLPRRAMVKCVMVREGKILGVHGVDLVNGNRVDVPFDKINWCLSTQDF